MRWLLVALQFSISAWIVLGTRLDRDAWWMLAFAIPGAGLAIWAWIAIGLTKIRIMPDVGPKTTLVVSPPYRWIRHPMYSGLLLFALALVVAAPSLLRIILWATLFVVLELKSRLEEHHLIARFPDYNQYRRTSWKFLPPIY